MLLEYRDMKAPLSRTSKYDSEPDECLLAFLQSHTASAAVGHWLSLLLKAADNEAARGHLGSVKLRIEAFMTLRVLVAKAVGRCLCSVSNVVQIFGGGLFSQCFRTDGSHFWKLLSTSPFHRKPNLKEERIPLQLPYRSTSSSSEESMAETSDLKVQAAVLNMIAELSRNGRSVSALEVVLKKVPGLVVGIACSGVVGLRDASVNALQGLAYIDADLIWLLLADVYYSMKNKNMPLPPTSDIPEISEIVPPPRLRKSTFTCSKEGTVMVWILT